MAKTIVLRYYAFFIALTVFLADQAIKSIVAGGMLFNQNITVMENILSITKIYNTGAAFGFFDDKTFFLTVFSAFIILWICHYLVKCGKSLGAISGICWGLILGGTIGNFVDRMSFGYVVDFIKLDFINFPIFNLADLSINIGAVILLSYILFNDKCNVKCGEVQNIHNP